MAKANRNALTAERARKLLHYDPNPGILTWKERTPDMFKDGKPGKYGKYGAERNCKIWNTKYAGKPIKCKRYDGYIVFRLDGFTYRAHRVIWLIQTGEWPAKDIDHKNVEEGNNVWSNLRAATRSQNIANTSLYKNNTSGYKGVSYNKNCGKYTAYIKKDGRKLHLGCFDDPVLAAAKRTAIGKELFGEFARTSLAVEVDAAPQVPTSAVIVATVE